MYPGRFYVRMTKINTSRDENYEPFIVPFPWKKELYVDRAVERHDEWPTGLHYCSRGNPPRAAT